MTIPLIKIQKTLQTITKWHWANKEHVAGTWRHIKEKRKKTGRNVRKWIEKMSAPCTCAPRSRRVCSRREQPRVETGGKSCFVAQVRSGRSQRVWVKNFWVICPHSRCVVCCAHTHTHVALRLFALSGHELRRLLAVIRTGRNQSRVTFFGPART